MKKASVAFGTQIQKFTKKFNSLRNASENNLRNLTQNFRFKSIMKLALGSSKKKEFISTDKIFVRADLHGALKAVLKI